MKTVDLVVAAVLLSCPACLMPQNLYAATLDSNAIAQKIVSRDSGEKEQIIKDKQKIAEERDGILAAERKLSQFKKTGDKSQIEQMKKEADEEIRQRRARISALKDEIENLQQGKESIAPGRKARAKEGK
jgi:microcompartment protein CcmL/EutN